MPFDLKQKPDLSQSVTFDYPQATVTNINLNSGDFLECNYVCGGSSPNIIYSKSALISNYKSNKLRIYGVLFKDLAAKIPHTGTLVIQNNPTTNSPGTVYMCFLLSPKIFTVPTDLDALMKTIDLNASPTLYLNNLTEGGSNNYIVYSGMDKMSMQTTNIIYMDPISVGSVSFNATKSDWIVDVNPKIYSIVKSNSTTAGEWMECDYAPMDTEEITTYNIPINSSVITESSRLDSFRTIIMFMVFLLLCVFAYLIIPSVYLAVIMKLLDLDVFGGKLSSNDDKKKNVLYIDIGLSTVFGLSGLILICVGAFADQDKVPDTSDILLSGIAISLVYIISYIVIQSKKMTGKFIEGVKYDYL
jgi:hypothetical protein